MMYLHTHGLTTLFAPWRKFTGEGGSGSRTTAFNRFGAIENVLRYARYIYIIQPPLLATQAPNNIKITEFAILNQDKETY